MPVTTVSADKITWTNGRPTIANKSQATTKKTNNKVISYKEPNRRRSKPYVCRAEQLTPRLDLVTPGSPVAVDCEGVILPKNTGWRRHGVGRISIVNIDGQVIYDTFVHYPREVEARPSPQRLKLGVKYQDLFPSNGAQPHAAVLAAAKSVFDKSGIVVGHAAENDMQMLDGIDFDDYVVRDTQKMRGWPFEGSNPHQPGLKALAAGVLDRDIQGEEHSSVEDARATMDLFLWHHERFGGGLDYAGEPIDSGSSSSDDDNNDDDASSTISTPASASSATSSSSRSQRSLRHQMFGLVELDDGTLIDCWTGQPF